MSLESLQKLRAQTVETLMMELAQITRTLAQREEQYRDMETKIQKDADAYHRQSVQGMTIEAWMEWQGRMDSQQAALRRTRREIDQAAEAWQHTKARLVEASRDRKLLDRVADKRLEARRVEVGRQEQRTTDESASRRHSTTKERNS